MKLFDTHAHVNDGRFDNDRNEMLQACFDTGVEYIMIPGVDRGTVESGLALAKQYDIQKVILFGSRARGDNWERSDIDLAVCGGNVTRFSLDVDEVIPTLLMFDVVDLDEPVQPELRAAIQREGVVIYEKV